MSAIRSVCALLVSACALVASSALAQDVPPPPSDPPPHAAPPSAEAAPSPDAPPAGHPPVDPGHSRIADVLRPPQLSTAAASPEVPPGTIRVAVVDETGRPVPNSVVDLGVLGSGGTRSRQDGRTGPDGVARFANLATGSGQAYRVNVPFRGATYSSTPFQLTTSEGYDVRITRLPVTTDDRFVFFHLFRLIVELRNERLHVIHQAELTNAGRATYTFPASGLRVAMPAGALNFQAQQVMSDQRIEPIAGTENYVLRGSLPPGTVELAWAFDLPVDGDEMRVPVRVPVRSYVSQVLVEAIPGLSMRVPSMPPPRRLDLQGEQCVDNEQDPGCVWATQERRAPEETPLRSITIQLEGIPGPGPGRWIAVGVALLFVALGAVLVVFGREDREGRVRALRERRERLLEQARELDAMHAVGEIGPGYRQSQRAAIVRELAVLLHEEETAKAAPEGRDAARAAGPAR